MTKVLDHLIHRTQCLLSIVDFLGFVVQGYIHSLTMPSITEVTVNDWISKMDLIA